MGGKKIVTSTKISTIIERNNKNVDESKNCWMEQ